MAYRLETPDRLGRAGIKKVGLGALFGLSDWRADAWFTGLHLRHIETCTGGQRPRSPSRG
jgi:2-iminoacetate synthase